MALRASERLQPHARRRGWVRMDESEGMVQGQRGSPPPQATMYMLLPSVTRDLCLGLLDATSSVARTRSKADARPDHQKKSSHDDASTSNDHVDIWLRVECCVRRFSSAHRHRGWRTRRPWNSCALVARVTISDHSIARIRRSAAWRRWRVGRGGWLAPSLYAQVEGNLDGSGRLRSVR